MSETITETETETETPETPQAEADYVVADKTIELGTHDVYNLVRGLSVLSAEKSNPQDVAIFIKDGALHMCRMDANHVTMTDVAVCAPEQYTEFGMKRDTDTSPEGTQRGLQPDDLRRLLTWCDAHILKDQTYTRMAVHITPAKFVLQQHDTEMPGGKKRAGARIELPLGWYSGVFAYPAMGSHRAYAVSIEHLHTAMCAMKVFESKRVAIHIRANEPSEKYCCDSDDNQYLKLCIGTHATWEPDAIVRVPLIEPASPPLELHNPDGSDIERETMQRVGNMAAYACERMSNMAFKRLVGTSKGAREDPYKKAVLRINKNGLCLWDFIGHGFRTSYWIAPVVDY